MMDADIIIPVAVINSHTRHLAMTAIRTCAATTAANILILINNTPAKEDRSQLENECEALGCKWRHIDCTPFNIGKVINCGIHATTSKYYGYFNQDSIFFPNWLENLISMWEQEPDYFTLAPYSFNLWGGQVFTGLPKEPQNKILETHIHGPAGNVHRRDKLFHCNEQVGVEVDSDLHQFIMFNKLREGYCLNSRVDHLGQGVVENFMKETGKSFSELYPQQESISKIWKLT